MRFLVWLYVPSLKQPRSLQTRLHSVTRLQAEVQQDRAQEQQGRQNPATKRAYPVENVLGHKVHRRDGM